MTGRQPQASLDGEIALLRALLERLELAAQDDAPTSELLKIVEVAGRTAARLGTLITQQRRIADAAEKDGGLQRELAEAYAALARRFPAQGLED